jgi:hypothetical protein
MLILICPSRQELLELPWLYLNKPALVEFVDLSLGFVSSGALYCPMPSLPFHASQNLRLIQIQLLRLFVRLRKDSLKTFKRLDAAETSECGASWNRPSDRDVILHVSGQQ